MNSSLQTLLASAPKAALDLDDSPQAAVLARWVDELSALAPGWPVDRHPDPLAVRPSLQVGRHGNIFFQAVADGKLADVFAEAVAGPTGDPPMDTDGRRLLEQLDLPLPLTVFVAPGCPHCPVQVRSLVALAHHQRLVRLTVVDAALFGDRARKAAVSSVPTTVADGVMKWHGITRPEEILAVAASRDPSALSADSLRQLLEDGQAARVAQMMVDQGKVFAALGDLLAHPRWSVRLGAMVVAEHLAEQAPVLASRLADVAWDRWQAADAGARGDLLYVIGLGGDPAHHARLQEVLRHETDEQVRQAAKEALEALAGSLPGENEKP